MASRKCGRACKGVHSVFTSQREREREREMDREERERKERGRE
jgi:hypothetical protein